MPGHMRFAMIRPSGRECRLVAHRLLSARNGRFCSISLQLENVAICDAWVGFLRSRARLTSRLSEFSYLTMPKKNLQMQALFRSRRDLAEASREIGTGGGPSMHRRYTRVFRMDSDAHWSILSSGIVWFGRGRVHGAAVHMMLHARKWLCGEACSATPCDRADGSAAAHPCYGPSSMLQSTRAKRQNCWWRPNATRIQWQRGAIAARRH